MKTKKENHKVAFAGRFDNNSISGPVKAASRIFSEHTKESNASFIQYFFDGGNYGLYKKLFGIEELVLNGNVIYTAGLFRIYGILKKQKPDIIHILNFERFAVFIFLFRFFNKVKIIYNSHSVIAYEDSELKILPYFYKLKNRFCENRFLKHSDIIVFPSARALDIAEEYYGLKISNALILPNGIDRIFHDHTRPECPNKALKLVFIHNSNLNRSGKDYLIKFISNEIISSEIEIYIISNEEIELPVKNNITVCYRSKMSADKLAEFYRDKDIFLSLNEYDTFSISTAEAMAAGLIPIITADTGISRYIDCGFNGFTVEYCDTKSLKDNIESLSGMNNQKRKELSANAAKIFESLSWNNVYEMYNNLYGGILK
ncbi:MAG: glycosyltransferase family 4 protein [Ignavibacteria bacterium]|nr:glycosyltransferase family 4 protein [Ignavibacteria bacterium]